MELPNSYSDGSQEHWPDPPYVLDDNDKFYHERMAKLWKEDGNTQGGVRSWQKLPSGYAIFIKPRKDNRVDRYLFGHPGGRFDSPNKFYPHFKHLMSGGQTRCDCVNCVQQRAALSRSMAVKQSRSGTQKGEPKIKVSLHAHEEISARVSGLIKSTYRASTNEPPANYIVEPFGNEVSPDRLHNGVKFGEMVGKYQNQPSFLPRKGELVLFYLNTEPNSELYLEEPAQHIRLYSHSFQRSLGYPEWRAAVVCNEPVEKLGFEDLKHNRTSPTQLGHVNRRLYKLEVYEDQGQIYQVNLSYIRPLNLFHELLSGLDQNHWHKSIFNALVKMNSASVVDPVMCFGEWPRVAITFKGAWLGSELLVVGDVVRIKDSICPPGGESEEERDCVIRIRQISCEYCLDECEDILEEPEMIKVRGEVLSAHYREGRSKHVNNDMLDAMNFSMSGRTSLRGLDWFEVEPTDSSGYTNVTVDCVLGRLYEKRAMELFTGSQYTIIGSQGVLGARKYAAHQTKGQVLPEEYSTAEQYHWDELNWLLFKDRIEALRLQPKDWRRWNRVSISTLWLQEKQAYLRFEEEGNSRKEKEGNSRKEEEENSGKREEARGDSADSGAMNY